SFLPKFAQIFLNPPQKRGERFFPRFLSKLGICPNLPEFARICPNLPKFARISPKTGVTGSHDDEYQWAGLEPPKVMVTTSRDPSARLRVFVKELCLIIPGARRLNRGRAEVGALLGACRAAGVTDLLVVHETRGRPGEGAGLMGRGRG
uniref:Brix domain-containing protein n=1 Tax=Anas platyrhynchos platyrhynchos TaxID=8840 RepID=A0A493TZ95_ANAPP